MTTLTRRHLIALTGAAALSPLSAQALSVPDSQAMVTRLVADVNAVIASGKSEAAMITEFGEILDRYADVPTIARYCLGADARRVDAAQMRAFTVGFRQYIASKYGRRFREFIGGEISVQGAQVVKQWVEVETTVLLRGQSPFQMDWHVSDRSGRHAFFNFIIEGVNMLLTERAEIGALLDRQRGDIGALTTELLAF